MGRKKRNKANEGAAKVFAPSFSIKAKDDIQKEFVNQIKNKLVIFGFGKAGTGKTLLSIHTALSMIFNDYYPQTKLFFVRSNVGLKGERDLGALPGDYNTKVNHLALPLFDNLSEFIPEFALERMFIDKTIQVGSMAALRGRSLKNTIIVLDEAQNSTYEHIKTAISRAGENSKIILIGDPQQVDILEEYSGFFAVYKKVLGVRHVGSSFFVNNYRNAEMQEILDLL